ncbi:phosphatases II [Mollisia scopiformis]|uniref:Phosphatases II n=1 Tax=Mollisia scopiformis TaxID=149040 RepID=A0A194WYD2_MOLSC|nr:phosphatases II [Mollisia scopiformis]KUJ12689.1 phosphatases II [Mollisia scopiformis]
MSDKALDKFLRKVPDVQVLANATVSTATLLLTNHHLIVATPHTPSSSQDGSSHQPKPKTREVYIAYPMIAQCTFRPTPPSSGLSSTIRLRCRDFLFVTFNFVDDRQARDVFETIKCQTCKLGSIEKLYAFTYDAPPIEKAVGGWELYDAKAEWKRQGISDKGIDRGWRISKINLDYAFSPTYPALLVVPSSISDNTLNYAGRYRSRVRIPTLTYLHPVNNCSITRSSQPMAGLRGNRSIQDEKLVSACFSASAQIDDGEPSSQTISRASPASSQADLGLPTDSELSETERLEDEMISASNIEIVSDKPHIYGAQQHNLIVDARPTVNALAMQAVGLGSENMDHYKFATKAYLGIENIHVMRDSLAKVIEAVKDSDISRLPPNQELLVKSGWLKHITGLLDGAALIARQVGIQHSHVLIHCSDGWDRTSQLSALSQLMLDPYYRTIEGFIVLIEKDWLAFGHMFQHRSGFLNSEKWFSTQNDALAGSAIQPGGNGEGRGDAIENALLSAKRFFNKSNASQDTVTDSDGELLSVDESPKAKRRSGTKDTLADKEATKPKETSPVFHQFLDCTYQLLHQYPTRFEFNERFLRRLLYHLYSCQYGTFLYNNEKSRLDARVQQRTASAWGYFLAQRAGFTNKDYDGGEIDDHVKGKERLLFPKLDKVRWWPELFNRKDQDMNGPVNTVTERYLGDREDSMGVGGGVLTGVETADRVVPAGSIRHTPPNGTQGKLASLREGISGLGIVKSMGGGGSKSPANSKQPLEVEMQ